MTGGRYTDTAVVTSSGSVYLGGRGGIGSGGGPPLTADNATVFEGRLSATGTNFFGGVILTPISRIDTWANAVFTGGVRFGTGRPQMFPAATLDRAELEGADPLVFIGPTEVGYRQPQNPNGISETTLRSSGGITLRGSTLLDGAATFIVGTNVDIRGYLLLAGSKVRNDGNLSNAGMPVYFSADGQLRNAPGGVMSWNGPLIVGASPFVDVVEPSGLWVNEGLIDLSSGSTFNFFTHKPVGIEFQQRGELLVGGGTPDFNTVDWGTNFTQFSGRTILWSSTLRGSPLDFLGGVLAGHGVIEPSTVSPESPALVLGSEATTEIKLRSKGSPDPDGTYSPDGSDFFDVRGTAQLGGRLAVTALPSFAWSPGDRYEVLRFVARGDTRFNDYTGLAFADGFFLQPILSATNLVLEVVNDRPVAVDDTMTVPFTDSFTIRVADLLTNDFSPGGGPLTLTGVSDVSAPEISVTVEPSDGSSPSQLRVAGPIRFRTFSFTYSVTNAAGQAASAVVTLAPVRRATILRDEQGSVLTLHFEGLPNANYRLESSTVLEGGHWLFLADVVADDSGLVTYTGPLPTDTRQFYRFRAL